MRKLISRWKRRSAQKATPLTRRWRCSFEQLEDRVVPAGNLIVTTAGSYPQQFFEEFTPTGALVRQLTIPPPLGSSGDTARDLVEDPSGNLYVYNGTFTPSLATWSLSTSQWTQQNYTGWGTVNNTSYGGLGLYQNYVFASDMTVAGDPAGASNGIVRFNVANGTATRFFQGTDFIDVNVGLDGKVYALTSNAVLYSFDPNSMALLGTLTLPAGHDYRGVAVNQTGEIFTANWDNSASHFTANGALIATVNLTGPNDGSWFGNPLDIKVASDGTLALGTRSGQAVQMTSSFTNISYIHTWVGSVQYPCFVNFAPTSSPSQPTVSIGNYSALEGNSGTTPFTFTVTLSAASSQSITVNYSTANGTATSGSDYQAVSSGNVTFAPGQTSQTITISVYGDTTLEPDETFTVKLTGVTGNATLGQTTGTGTIRNDDLPTITIYNQGIYEGSSGSANANFTVYLSAASTQTVTVNYATADGTATAGSDYAAVSGTLTFAPGQTSATISVPVYGDTVDEADELYYVNLSNPVNATLANTQGRGTIYNDDLSISVSDAAPVTEGNSGSTPAYFTVSLSAASTHTVTVSYYTNGGTATAGSDYTSTSGTLTFNPGQTSITVPVYVLGDTLYEGNETFSFWLTQASNALINRISGTATIVDDDPSTTISVSDASALEGNSGTSGLTFTVTLNAASTQTVTVNYSTAAGTATAGTDYQSLSGTLSFAPGQTSKTVTVYAIGDTLQESNETFTLNLSGATNATISRAVGTGTILDDDSPGLSVGNVSVVEGNSGTIYAVFTVTLSPTATQTVTVNYATASGTATSGSDFYAASGTLTFYAGQTSAYVYVSVLGDLAYETNETFTLNLSNAVNATIRSGTGTGTIVNDDGIPSLSVTDVTNSEGNTATTTGWALVSLSAPSYQPITFTYSTANGTALAGVDYASSSGTLTINPGQTGLSFPIPLYGDTTPEPTKAFYVNVSSVTNATLARSQGTVTIANDDGPTVSIYGNSITEGNSGTQLLTFTVQLSAPATQTTTVDYATSDGSTTAGSDYQATSGTLTFNPGEMTKYVSVVVYGDTMYEQNDFFYVRLSNAAYCVIGGTNYSATGYINNDDVAPTLSVNDVSVVEGNTGTVYAVFTVTLSAVSGLPATTYYQTIAGTATSGTDYYATSGYIYIPVGQTSATVSVAVRGDTTIEADETFTLNLYSPGSATLGRANGTGTIVNDDFPVVSVAPASLVEGNSGTSYMAFTLSLSASSPQTISVNYATSDIVSVGGGGPIPATAGVDYQATSGTATFAPGQTTATVLVPIYGDKLVEPDEAFGLGLSNPVNATLSALPGNYGTILNDDHAPVANAGPNQTVNEGATVTFDGSGSTDADGDALSYFWSFGDGSGGSGVNPTHVYADNGVYTVTLTVSDGANTSSSTLTVTVQNVAPTVAVSGPTDAVPGQDRTFAFSATDPSSVDQAGQFTYQINWGDGITQTVQGPASGIQVSHVFTAVGSVSVSATATDKDGGTSAAGTQTVTVVAAELQGGDLIVGGTTGDDHIVIQPADANGTVEVVVNGQDLGTFVPTGKVVVYGQSGNDLIEVVPLTAGDGSTTSLAVPVMLFGGDGDDTLDARGASGPVVLSGGVGNDTLWGGSGRNLLFGGSGADVLHGGTADDLLIGGSSSYDANVADLLALQAEWSRTDADYLTRLSDLNGTSGGGLNGTYVLNGLTVVDDAAVDSLFGNLGQDWFFAANGGANPDQVNDLEAGEQVTLL